LLIAALRGWEPAEVRIAIQGFGNAGQSLARLLHTDGYRVVGISDSKGGVYDDAGLDIPHAIEQKNAEGKLLQSDSSQAISNAELLELDVDVLVPAALESQLTRDNADRVRATVVFELANGPTTAEADEILHANGVLVVPDVLANAGGVTVSWFEWLQNRAGQAWSLDDVHTRLHDKMQNQFHAVHSRMESLESPMRTAAYVLALERLDAALSAGGTAESFAASR